MKPNDLLVIFLVLRFAQHLVERFLAFKNKQLFTRQDVQAHAQKALNISEDEMTKTIAYSLDKYKFGLVSSWIGIFISLGFIGLGGLGWAEGVTAGIEDPILRGILFMGFLGVLSSVSDLPFDLYHTFSLEERHGFNKQTVKGFVLDRVKGAVLGSILGGALLGAILFIMGHLSDWWFWAWIVIFSFNLVIAWIFPTVLAPLFNKFSPLPEGDPFRGR